MDGVQSWSSALTQIGGTGLIMWWLTQKLIPKMIEAFDRSLLVFQQEMEKERILHREINTKLSERNEKTVDELVAHLSSRH